MFLFLLPLLKSYWKHIVIILAIVSTGFFVYNFIYARGERVANEACAARMLEYTNKLDTRIEGLIAESRKVSDENKERSVVLRKDISQIYKLAKDKPLTIINEGNCLPTPNFIDAINAAVGRVNVP